MLLLRGNSFTWQEIWQAINESGEILECLIVIKKTIKGKIVTFIYLNNMED